MSECKTCGAAIEWVKTRGKGGRGGQMMPLDPGRMRLRRSAAGNVLVVTDAGEVVRGVPAEEASLGLDEVSGRVSHFATCPQANAHRRGKDGGA